MTTATFSEQELHERLLLGVSRSFAVCIPLLDRPLRRSVSAAYLLCRAADTIEDAPWGDRAEQWRQFDRFEALLAGAGAGAAARLAAAMPRSIPEAERELIASLPQLMATLRDFDPPVRDTILATLRTMTCGMRYFLSRAPHAIVLRSVGEVNLYCFFVAGIVGEMLTKLVAYAAGTDAGGGTFEDAHRFGRFLQKVNILKDAAEDARSGRQFAAAGLEATIAGDADGALRYILAIPRTRTDYRAFCAFSLLLGLYTLRDRGDRDRSTRRETVMRLLQFVRTADDRELQTAFHDLRKHLPDAPHPIDPFDPGPLDAVTTSVSASGLSSLGIILRSRDAPRIEPPFHELATTTEERRR